MDLARGVGALELCFDLDSAAHSVFRLSPSSPSPPTFSTCRRVMADASWKLEQAYECFILFPENKFLGIQDGPGDILKGLAMILILRQVFYCICEFNRRRRARKR